MGNIQFSIDKTNTFSLVNQLSIDDKKELIKQLKEDGSGVAVAAPVESSDKEEYLGLLRKTHDYSQEEFDKNILYISSSTLGLTLAFIEKIAPLKEAVYKWDLWFGWFMLGATILLFVLSHHISAHVINWLITRVNNVADNVKSVRKEENVKRLRDNGGRFIASINWVLYAGMATGIISIMSFLYHNLLK